MSSASFPTNEDESILRNYITEPLTPESNEKCLPVMKTSNSLLVFIAALKYFSALKTDKLLDSKITELASVTNKCMVNGYFLVASQSLKINMRIAGFLTITSGEYSIGEVNAWFSKPLIELKTIFEENLSTKTLPSKLIDFLVSYSEHLPSWILSFGQKANTPTFLSALEKYKNANTESFVVKLYVAYFVEHVSQKQKTAELLQTLKLNSQKYSELVLSLKEHIINFPNRVDLDTMYYVLKSTTPIKTDISIQNDCLIQHYNNVVVDVLAKDGVVLDGNWDERLSQISANKASLTQMSGEEVVNLMDQYHLHISPVSPVGPSDRYITCLKKRTTTAGTKKRKAESDK